MPAQTALDWAPAALQRQLQPVLPGIEVVVLACTDSTNSRLVQRARDGDVAPCLLVAETQTAGRGRLGRSWHSHAGASLTFSLGLPLAPRAWSGLSAAVGLALADAIEPLAPGQRPRLQLKWPNDLWLADGAARWRKLAGVLIETVAAGGGRQAVIGVGVNVAAAPPQAALAEAVACAQELRVDIGPPALLALLAPPLLLALRRFEAEGFTPCADGWARRDLLRGHEVSTTLAACPDGRAEGVDADGALLVRRGGVLHRLSSGEVSVRPRHAVAPAAP